MQIDDPINPFSLTCQVVLFRHLSVSCITRILSCVHERKVPKGKLISVAGESVDEWLILAQGAADIVADDKETIILTFLPGTTIGEVSEKVYFRIVHSDIGDTVRAVLLRFSYQHSYSNTLYIASRLEGESICDNG